MLLLGSICDPVTGTTQQQWRRNTIEEAQLQQHQQKSLVGSRQGTFPVLNQRLPVH